MSDSIEVSDLLLALYRASRELPVDQFQDAVLELLRPSIAFDSAQWGSGPHKTDWISKRQVHLYREPDDAAEIYEEVKDQDDAVKLAWRKKRGVLNYNIADLMTGKSRLGIRDYAKRVEHANLMLSFDIHPTTALEVAGFFWTGNGACLSG